MNTEHMPTDIANGFISIIEKKNMPVELKLWAIDKVKNFNTLCYGQRKMLYDNVLSKLAKKEVFLCCECDVELDGERDGDECENFRCNNCYWEDQRDGGQNIIEPDYRYEEEVEVNCICDKCFGEGTCMVSKKRAKELKEMELMEECCPYGDKCNGEEEEEEEEEEEDV